MYVFGGTQSAFMSIRFQDSITQKKNNCQKVLSHNVNTFFEILNN